MLGFICSKKGKKDKYIIGRHQKTTACKTKSCKEITEFQHKAISQQPPCPATDFDQPFLHEGLKNSWLIFSLQHLLEKLHMVSFCSLIFHSFYCLIFLTVSFCQGVTQFPYVCSWYWNLCFWKACTLIHKVQQRIWVAGIWAMLLHLVWNIWISNNNGGIQVCYRRFPLPSPSLKAAVQGEQSEVDMAKQEWYPIIRNIYTSFPGWGKNVIFLWGCG